MSDRRYAIPEGYDWYDSQGRPLVLINILRRSPKSSAEGVRETSPPKAESSPSGSSSHRLPVLPCHPCPHKGACCSWGASLADDERVAIVAARGADKVVWSEQEEGYRTAASERGCVFLGPEGACAVHDEPYYPEVCRLFPYEDVEGGPYKSETGICPELATFNSESGAEEK